MENVCWKFLRASDRRYRGKQEEAKEYKEDQEKAAERNAALINRRTLNAQNAAQMGKRAMNLGASKAQVRTAMASGMEGVAELYQKLEAAANQRGVKRLRSR